MPAYTHSGFTARSVSVTRNFRIAFNRLAASMDTSSSSSSKPKDGLAGRGHGEAVSMTADGASHDKILLQPFYYISQIPGKEIRKKLAKAFDYWMHVDDDKLKVIGQVVQMLHNASLLIDDIEDNSKLRRGIPVAHSIYGVASTINAANYAYFLSLEKILRLNNTEATRVFSEQMLELHRGQGMEIYWRDNFVCPSEDDYKLMVIRKTGGLFGLAVKMMQIFSESQSTIAAIMGLHFQIRDDYMNLQSKQHSENKSYCEDLTEGKYSFPIIHAIRTRAEDTRIINILRQRTTDVEIKKYCVDLLEEFGSFEYTRKVLTELDKQAIDEISILGGNPHLLHVLDELRDWE